MEYLVRSHTAHDNESFLPYLKRAYLYQFLRDNQFLEKIMLLNCGLYYNLLLILRGHAKRDQVLLLLLTRSVDGFGSL